MRRNLAFLILLLLGCAEPRDEEVDEIPEQSQEKRDEPKTSQQLITASLSDPSNWEFEYHEGFIPIVAAGFGPDRIPKSYCVSWSQTLPREVTAEYLFQIERPSGAKTASAVYAHTCDEEVGLYKLSAVTKAGSRILLAAVYQIESVAEEEPLSEPSPTSPGPTPPPAPQPAPQPDPEPTSHRVTIKYLEGNATYSRDCDGGICSEPFLGNPKDAPEKTVVEEIDPEQLLELSNLDCIISSGGPGHTICDFRATVWNCSLAYESYINAGFTRTYVYREHWAALSIAVVGGGLVVTKSAADNPGECREQYP